MENTNCCSTKENNNSNCCPPPIEKDTNVMGMKKKVGTFLLGLAIILGISSAFKAATQTNDIGVLPPSIEDFEWLETDKEVAYVFLKGKEEEQNKLLSKQIIDVLLELNESGDSAEYYELSSTHQHYNDFMKQTSVETVPTLVVLGRGGELSLINEESMNSIKLFKAYVAATTPVTSCKPSSCNPSKKCTPAQKAKCGVKKQK